jgi:RimJ/RimL family protein N-acetyltransferase
MRARRRSLALGSAMNKPPTRKTRQLLLRAPEPSDVERLFMIQSDATAMQFTYCSADREATAAYIESYARRFMEDGFAPWTAVFVPENRVVGWGGLNKDPSQPYWGVEVAYFIDRSYWGRGLATDLVQASLSHGFAELGLPQVGAFARRENHASGRVLANAGFVRVGFVPELERDEFRISAAQWRVAAQPGDGADPRAAGPLPVTVPGAGRSSPSR